MTPIDVSKIKRGDEIAVRARVDSIGPYVAPKACAMVVTAIDDRPSRIAGQVSGSNRVYFGVLEINIISHTPAAEPICVGDMVRNKKCAQFPDHYLGGEVLAIWKNRAWVLFPNIFNPGDVSLDDLEHVPS